MRSRHVFHGLDALRGYAALSVVLLHARTTVGLPWLEQSGYLAVDLFFLISGFVIAHNYEAMIADGGATRFMLLRLIRFSPLYWAGGLISLVTALSMIATHRPTPVVLPNALAYFFYLPAPGSPHDHIAPLNDPGWSLLFEIYINLLYALALPLLRNRTLLAIVLLAGAGLCVTAALNISLDGGLRWETMWIGSLRVLFSFPLGLLAYRFKDRLPKIRLPNLLIAGLVLAMLCLPPAPWRDLLFILIVSPLFVTAALSDSRPSAAATYGARASYCIYALHLPLIGVGYAVAHLLRVPEYWVVVPLLCLLLITAPAIDRRLDYPVRRRLTGALQTVMGKRQKARAPAFSETRDSPGPI